MALDEALLEAATPLGRPVLRFYGWTEPAASFGYFQKFAEVERMTGLRPLVRRPTGGGLVSHETDWTYSLVVPAGHEWHSLRAAESYARMHAWVREAFARLGVTTRLAERPRIEAPGRCFAGAEKADVLWQDRKIAGAAQRRNRHGLLIQGSVQPPAVALTRTAWETAMLEALRPARGVEWDELALPEVVHVRASELAALKYSRREHLQRR
jgi:lipoate-protein ligase A